MSMRPRGFTLIELLVAITLVAVLLALGLPAMGTYIQNNKIASAASNYAAGLQTARAEAVRTNLPTEFVLTNGTGVGAAPAVDGRNWVVRLMVPVADGGPRLVDQKTGLEGEGSAAQAVQLTVVSAPATFDGRIVFNGFGRPTGAPAEVQSYSLEIGNSALGACGTARCRRVNVTPLGQVAMCDPAAPAGSGDSRAC